MSEVARARGPVAARSAAEVVERVVENLDRAVRAPRRTLELCVLCLLAEGHDTLLVPLSAHVDDFTIEIHVAEVERDGLLASEPRRVEELEQRTVAQREWRLPRDELEQGVADHRHRNPDR